jgi:hypothetical protein
LKWLPFLWGITLQTTTSRSVLRWRTRLEPVEHLHQLLFEQLEFGDLLSDGAQLLRHEGMQSGPHGQTLPIV